MKRVLSYFWPLTKYINSSKNGRLEITWSNGKKILDSENSNYSYGSLERILNYGISTISLDPQMNILLFGLGGGCVIQVIDQQIEHQGKITAVEIDETIIEIAKTEFNISEDNRIEIICEDAFSFADRQKSKYDLIIIDLFIGKEVPQNCYSTHFWKQIINSLTPNGWILFNAGIQLKNEIKIDNIIQKFGHKIKFQKHSKVEGTNTLLIGNKSAKK